ncbi:type II toxin-antitoxin system VapC family toxin [Xenorhabdus bovienii]|uniref:Ribonuclease VapC n=1 Tax=Xenorhabdus bovienii TaxID=40576 RepID=A0AAJ1MZ01_XENBV|nr:type II toxin-antitoxin system VapC family toxin [Xenorhabdus bovienii]MDE1478238.1 type II toxin-antitoxin system VapC family toxin [Xenorhabdus bovienii]MDE1485919.1 type II toxin-antitoxin system VapC family toxin [Xenorhabdus bovienii]MDE1489639.1 type II toxin-antitoxin system VapC family toxin [Xenorhabdus bovienii]MDE1493580.1 type II toxin-antitoxin system VapC family toxin [Xenorhabdus bovienii]MDE9472294.1 type II toxin-antitoxin system VapC family toxin [Xenorhabdus bovienii]
MIVLDTNVISETLRQFSEPCVIEWLDSQPIETLYLSTITLAELRFGMASLPPGKRRDNLQKSLESRVLPLFAGRLLPFDMLASQSYGELMAKARTLGLAISKADGYIAATAIANGMMVATRDVSPFKAADVDVINPWES